MTRNEKISNALSQVERGVWDAERAAAVIAAPLPKKARWRCEWFYLTLRTKKGKRFGMRFPLRSAVVFLRVLARLGWGKRGIGKRGRARVNIKDAAKFLEKFIHIAGSDGRPLTLVEVAHKNNLVKIKIM